MTAPLLWSCMAHAHGIAGNRYFDGTLTFDDPAVADEAIVPLNTYTQYPTQDSNVVENRLNWSFARLLTPTLAFTADSGWVHQSWPIGHTSGPDKADIGLKYEAFRDNRHETLVSASLTWGIGHTGSSAVGADAPNTIQPGVFFGKGFGDLPDSLSWLRPFAVTGAIVDEIPVGSTRATALASNPATGRFDSVLSPGVETLHWGFSIQYSTLYLTSRFNGGPPKDEPLNQLVPLVEFRFDSPRGQNNGRDCEPRPRLCRSVVATRRRSDPSFEPCRRKRSGLSRAATALSRRHAAFSVRQAAIEQQARTKSDRVVIAGDVRGGNSAGFFWRLPEPARQQDREAGACKLRGNECGHPAGCYARESIGQ